MNIAKRTLALLLCLVMVLSYMPVTGNAADGATNIGMELSDTEVNVGDTFTILVYYDAMKVSSFAAPLKFDKDLVEFVSAVPCDPEYPDDFGLCTKRGFTEGKISTPEEANGIGQIGFVVAGTEDVSYKACDIYTATFRAKAAGTVTFTLSEDSAGADGFKGVAQVSTVTIGGAQEPECEHTSTKLVSNADGTHNVVCTNEACNGHVVRTETCSGTDDGDHTTAVKCACGNTVTAATEHTYTQNLRGTMKSAGDCNTKAVYAVKCDNCDYESTTLTVEGEYGDHAYGTLIPAQEAVHSQTEQKPAVAAHYHCSECGKYFTEGKVETTLEALTGDTPVHTEGDPVKNTEESTDASCTEGGTLVEDIFCTECGAFIRKVTTPVAATCTTGTVEYTWGTDNATCKAQLICEHGTVLKEEEVTTTSEVTTVGTCQTAEVVTYYADFANFDDTSIPVTGEKDMNNHVGTQTTSYVDNGENHTKTVTCSCGGTVSSMTEDHNFNNPNCDPHFCICGKVETFTLTFDLNGGTLADEYADELAAFVQDGKFVIPDVRCGIANPYSEFYYEGVLLKEGYHITGFAEEDGTFHSLESDDTFTMEGDTTLAVVWEVNTYTLTVNVLATGEEVELTVPYGANLLEVLAQAAEEGKIPALGQRFRVNDEYQNGENIPYRYSYNVGDEDEPDWIVVDETTTMPAENFAIDQDHSQIGWVFSDLLDGRVGAEYFDFEDGWLGSGWHYIEENYDDVEGGAWYYFAEGTGDWEGWFFRVEGLTRVPYPTEAINGITYAPDADALAYCESKGTTFIDATEAWFGFGADGKFQSGFTGLTAHPVTEGAWSYAADGMLTWHPGLVSVNNTTYYFVGDETNGGNIAAEGDTWITKNSDNIEGFTIGHIYNFKAGKLSGAHGIVDGKYYENSRLMAGNGLTKVGENYIYVRSNGYIVVNAEYYVPANTLGVVPGTYSFDANGFLVEPEMTEKDGIVAENGALYFYENGKIAYNKGLIAYNGGYIYVRSNGQLAIGDYYVTNVADNHPSGVKSGDKVTFGADGYMVAAKNGIVDGYYYEDGKIAYGAGIVEIEAGKYIYVRSNGQVVVDTTYWITNVGDSGLVAKLYTFDADGILQNPEFVADAKNGVVDGYYYENGNIVYGAGLMEYNGGYIYVRSNGKVATGKYWVTNTNGLMEAGYYVFGEDGMMIIM